MANLIDTTYFIRELHLPTDEIGTELTSFIDRFEPEILQKRLSYDLYRAFKAGLLENQIAQKWIDLRDGKEYQSGGIYYKWRGLINSDKISLIANYVFYQFSIYGSTFNSSVGLQSIKSENSTIADYRDKQTLVYNQMINYIAELDAFITYSNSVDSTTYPNYDPTPIRRVNKFNI